ncbi:hypothetical protein ACTWKD_04045 [Halanaerobium saccharolyticum]|uniref:Uncharacterized protein n=1 Tax=Halanaerobium saccharolyticum TaxID=43595 RepID=A0A2T5RLJ4_9FIRM|nr:hypothetical protein [Halanaerobium saccharolyticum]PTW00127.1 hypothetical protein C8C76_10819 [Halanaerobium saccharolyticum]
MSNSKIRASFVNGEIEIVGEDSFVRDHVELFEKTIEIMAKSHKNSVNNEIATSSKNNKELKEESNKKEITLEITDSFGEWFQKFKKDLTEKDKALIAAYYIQKNSSEEEFKTIKVTRALKEYGISLSNTSLYISSLKKYKYIFPTEKRGNVKYYKISKDGENYLESLIRE